MMAAATTGPTPLGACRARILERYLLRGMGKLSVPQPPAMPRAPWLALLPKAVSQQERLNADAISSNVLARGMSCANKVTECFVEFVR